jgi:hypothetical protein
MWDFRFSRRRVWRWELWNLASYSFVEVDRRFKGAYCLNHQGDRGQLPPHFTVLRPRDSRLNVEICLLFLCCTMWYWSVIEQGPVTVSYDRGNQLADDMKAGNLVTTWTTIVVWRRALLCGWYNPRLTMYRSSENLAVVYRSVNQTKLWSTILK